VATGFPWLFAISCRLPQDIMMKNLMIHCPREDENGSAVGAIFIPMSRSQGYEVDMQHNLFLDPYGWIGTQEGF